MDFSIEVASYEDLTKEKNSDKYQFILPPLSLLNKDEEEKMLSELKKLNFYPEKNIAA